MDTKRQSSLQEAVLRSPRLVSALLILLTSLVITNVSARTRTEDEIEYFLELLNDPSFARDFVQSDVYVLDITKDLEKRITNTPAKEQYPSVSDDGQKIIFSWEGLFLLKLNGMEYTQIVDDKFSCREGRWVPQGGGISFVGRDVVGSAELLVESNKDIFLVSDDGGTLQNLTNTPDADEFGHDWSRDGKRLAYIGSSHSQRSNYSVWIRDIHGSGSESLLTETPDGASKLAWSPDGKKVYCSLFDAKHEYELVFIDVSSGEVSAPLVHGLNSNHWDVSPVESIFLYRNLVENGTALAPENPFSSTKSLDGDMPLWSNNGQFVVFTRTGYPENFISDIQKGMSPDKYNMLVIKSDGSLELLKDTFNVHSPIVEEVVDKANESSMPIYRDLTKKEAAALLSDKLLGDKVRIDDYEWGEE